MSIRQSAIIIASTEHGENRFTTKPADIATLIKVLKETQFGFVQHGNGWIFRVRKDKDWEQWGSIVYSDYLHAQAGLEAVKQSLQVTLSQAERMQNTL